MISPPQKADFTAVKARRRVDHPPSFVAKRSMPAVVLKIGRLVLHHGAVGIIRSLGRLGVPVYSVVEDQLTPAALSRYLTGAIIWEIHGMDSARFLEGMSVIAQKLGERAILIPTDDVSAILMAEHTDALRPWFAFPELPASLPRTLANKRELYRLCQSMNVPCPPSVFPNSDDEVADFIDHTSFPIVVKAAESWMLPLGSHTTFVAWDAKQARIYCERVKHVPRPNIIFQEFIDRDHGEDWFYHGYRNIESECLIGFTGRKIRSFPSDAGPTTLGQAVENDALHQHASALLSKIGYAGIMDLDFRLDKGDGQYKLLDFNPRVGAQFRLFEDTEGVDVARALYFDLSGKPLLRGYRQAKERTFVAEFHDFATSSVLFLQGRLKLREWLRSLTGAKEMAWFSSDDVIPFFVVCARLPLTLIRRLFRMKFAPVMSKLAPRFEKGRRFKHVDTDGLVVARSTLRGRSH